MIFIIPGGRKEGNSQDLDSGSNIPLYLALFFTVPQADQSHGRGSTSVSKWSSGRLNPINLNRWTNVRKTHKFCSAFLGAPKAKEADEQGLASWREWGLQWDLKSTTGNINRGAARFVSLTCHHLSLKDSCARANNSLRQLCLGKEQIKSVKQYHWFTSKWNS